MDKNRIEGQAEKAKGSIKEAAGKVLGNEKMRMEGHAEKAKGHVKEAAGKAADAAHEGIDRASETLHKTMKH